MIRLSRNQLNFLAFFKGREIRFVVFVSYFDTSVTSNLKRRFDKVVFLGVDLSIVELSAI